MSKDKISENDDTELIAAKLKNAASTKALVTVIIILVIIIVLMLVGFGIYKAYLKKAEEEKRITSIQVNQRLEEVSDLTTEKLVYNGYIHYEEGDIPFINKKSYGMTYEAEVKAGIDMNEIKVYEDDGIVIIEIPEADVQSVYVDPDSIEFYDESFALFNWDDKQDGVDAIKNAELDVTERADIDSLKKEADKHARELIENLFSEQIADGEVEVR